MTRFADLFAAGAAILVLVATGEAHAAAARLPAGVPAAAQLLLRFDANGDGIVTHDEMEAGLKADYAAADSNHDGCINPAEMAAENARRLARDGAQASPLRDWNLDGCVDIHEFSNTAHAYFQLADRSKDNKVTMLELRGPSMPIAPPSSNKVSASQASSAANNSLGAPQSSNYGSGGPQMPR